METAPKLKQVAAALHSSTKPNPEKVEVDGDNVVAARGEDDDRGEVEDDEDDDDEDKRRRPMLAKVPPKPPRGDVGCDSCCWKEEEG